MAMVDDDQDEGNKDLEKLKRSLKTNQRLFFAALSTILVVVAILITSVVVINVQLNSRREVPAEEFAEQLAELESHLQHLIEIHNSEAKVYFDFQDRLTELETLYTQEEINQLRRAMTERERDHRKLLGLMEEGASSLALMMPGSRDWTKAYSVQLAEAQKLSQKREAAIKEAMMPPPPEVANAGKEVK